MHPGEHVGQAHHADAGHQGEEAAAEQQHRGDDVAGAHAPLRSMKRATVTVPRNPSTPTTSMAPR